MVAPTSKHPYENHAKPSFFQVCKSENKMGGRKLMGGVDKREKVCYTVWQKRREKEE